MFRWTLYVLECWDLCSPFTSLLTKMYFLKNKKERKPLDKFPYIFRRIILGAVLNLLRLYAQLNALRLCVEIENCTTIWVNFTPILFSVHLWVKLERKSSVQQHLSANYSVILRSVYPGGFTPIHIPASDSWHSRCESHTQRWNSQSSHRQVEERKTLISGEVFIKTNFVVFTCLCDGFIHTHLVFQYVY